MGQGICLVKQPPKYVRQYKDRHGVHRLQFRRKGHRAWTLRPPLFSDDFWADYNAAMNDEVPPGKLDKNHKRPPPMPTASSGSLTWLVQQYKGSAAFQQLQTRTQIVRAAILDRVCMRHGHAPFARMERQHVLRIRDEMADRPSAANNMLKALRQVFNYGVDYNVPGLQLNPLRDIKNLKSNNPDGFHCWTLEEIAKFENHHPIGSKARLAMALLLYTGQRRSDIVVLGRQHVKNGRLEFTQIKNRKSKPAHLSIPILPELQKIINASPCGDLTFLVTEFGKPYTNDGFGNWFRRMCRSAGLKDCSAHGLRKAAAAGLAEIGCTDHEIMSITGHRTQKEVKRYTDAARQKVLADNAIQKVQEDINRTKVSYQTAGSQSVRHKG
jgi:integrase